MPAEVTSEGTPPQPDEAARRASTRLLVDSGAGLGRLAEVAGWIAAVQGASPPQPFRRIRAAVVAEPSDVDEPSDVGPALDALALGVGVTRRLVEIAPVNPLGDGSARRRREAVPELSEEEFEAAHELGRFVADEEADAGTDLLIVGSGPGTREQDLTAASALVAALLGREPVAMIGTDTGLGSATGLDDRAWMRRVGATRDALRRTRTRPAPEPADLLRLVGGGRIAVLAGILRQSAMRRTAVLLDGTVTCAAALAAERLSPGGSGWWCATTTAPEPAGGAALDALGLRPLSDLGVRAGDGSAALLVVPLLEAALDAAGALADRSGG